MGGGSVGGGGDLVSYPGDVSSDQQIADRIARNRAEVDAIVAAGGGSIAPVPNVLDASQSDDLYNQYFQENFRAAQEHAESNPYGQTTGVPLYQQGFTTGESLLPPSLYDSQPTQEQLDYAKTSLDPFGGAGPDVTSGPITGLVSGGGADGVGNFGKVGDFFGGLVGGLNVTGPPVENKVTSYSHATDNDREFDAFYDTQIKDPLSGKMLTPFQLSNRLQPGSLGAQYADMGITSLGQILDPTPPPPPQVIKN